MSAGPERTEPAAPAPSTPPGEASTPPAPAAAPPAVTTSMAGFGGNESCPNCGARMAVDQRYCLNCGHRRGEPRLPFMDAVTFMESMSSPRSAPGAAPPAPPAEPKSNRMNANAALIAGVATLVLAIGVGFLIGRTGHNESASGGGAVKVVQVGGATGGGGEEAVAATGGAETAAKSGGGGKAGSKSGGKKSAKNTKASEVKEGSKEEEELAAEKTAETLHAEGPLAKPTAEVGEKCAKGTPGCEGEEFTGNFFGE